MKEKDIKILAIETSCDETSASVICDVNYRNSNNQETITKQSSISNLQFPQILSNVVSSQINLHKKTGGVVPEVASRAHMEKMIPVISEALEETSRRQISKSEFLISNKIPNPNNKNPKKLMKLKANEADLLEQITHIAVTNGPGLIGSLLVGFNTAKALAYALKIPIIPINHIEGHIYSAFSGENSKSETLNPKQIPNSKSQIQNDKTMEQWNNETIFPLLALTVSGGHTSLTLMKDHGVYKTIGQTLDDAAGEAFDKVAKMLNLGYPGGPAVSKLACEFRNRITNNQSSITKEYPITNNQYPINSQITNSNKLTKLKANEAKKLKFPRPMIDSDDFNFSFSGLKTAVLYEIKNHEFRIKNQEYKEQICYEFEEAVVDVLVTKTLRATEKFKPKSVILAGGVAANNRLRLELEERLLEMSDVRCQMLNKKSKIKNKKVSEAIKLYIPPIDLCGDNAAMIGLAAYYHILRGDVSNWDKIQVDSNLKL